MTRVFTIHWSPEVEFHALEKAPVNEGNGIYMILEQGFRQQRPEQYRGKAKELIYIGIVKSEFRSMFKRIQEHRAKWLNEIARDQIFVRFGRLESALKITPQLIEDAESALVFEHQPSENWMKKEGYTIARDLVVHNRHHGGYLKNTIRTSDHTG